MGQWKWRKQLNKATHFTAILELVYWMSWRCTLYQGTDFQICLSLPIFNFLIVGFLRDICLDVDILLHFLWLRTTESCFGWTFLVLIILPRSVLAIRYCHCLYLCVHVCACLSVCPSVRLPIHPWNYKLVSMTPHHRFKLGLPNWTRGAKHIG